MKSITPHNALPHRYPSCNIVNTIFAFFDKVCDDKHHVTEAIQNLKLSFKMLLQKVPLPGESTIPCF